ncbi:PrgI family protein [Patescibacteria group bacterium]|nr:PrgI family protein [Patescibacteria group bacterium]
MKIFFVQQFQVPQFITVEDKVIGFLTIRQFIFLMVGAVILLLLYSVFTLYVFIPLALPIGGLAVAFAFVKIDERPFAELFLSAVKFYTVKPKLYIWKKAPPAQKKAMVGQKKEEEKFSGVPKLSQSKLADLAWSLDIKEKLSR